MARFYGTVGFVQYRETKPGVWEESRFERTYSGDVTRNMRKSETGDGLNDNMVIDNVIEITCDAIAMNNLTCIRYVEWMGVAWKVARAEIRRPRIILTLGGVYNEKQTRTT